ncbi:hypothetical protein NP233_g7 [Leucocoprinus birnbaumii]|uniref:DUF6532 domain-containing protein n=1 Tax=Leucocoprinus birnbaumii TaxID=56174 RepID=A0AAD5Z0I0_9AGAR|nr:hypothetical protein NP233_g7 [Leucocoprinus birnbaumii]
MSQSAAGDAELVESQKRRLEKGRRKALQDQQDQEILQQPRDWLKDASTKRSSKKALESEGNNPKPVKRKRNTEESSEDDGARQPKKARSSAPANTQARKGKAPKVTHSEHDKHKRKNRRRKSMSSSSEDEDVDRLNIRESSPSSDDSEEDDLDEADFEKERAVTRKRVPDASQLFESDENIITASSSRSSHRRMNSQNSRANLLNSRMSSPAFSPQASIHASSVEHSGAEEPLETPKKGNRGREKTSDKPTKRDATFQNERPEVIGAAASGAPAAPARIWPAFLHVFKKLGIKKQKPIVKDLGHRAFEICERAVVVENAFIETRNREAYREWLMRESADILLMENEDDEEYKVLKERTYADEDFRTITGNWAMDRIAHARTLMRAAALIHIAHFRLGDDELCGLRVQHLLKDHSYVYPGRWSEDSTQPPTWIVDADDIYLNMALVKTIRRAWFDTPKAFGTQYTTEYKSSIRTDKEAKEFTIPLVALACAAMNRFRGEKFIDVYERHVEILEGLKKNHTAAFHSVMSRLYTRVRDKNASKGSAASAKEGNPVALFNLRAYSS